TSTVSQWENGKRIPSNEVLSKIALRYQVTLDDLLNRDYSDSPTMVDFFVKLREKGGGLLNDLRLLFPIVASRSDKE
ncbi:helix-turn-helix domain-containing protein, partial [Streptococcus pyogenes]